MSELQFLKEARLDGRVEWRVPMAEMTTLRVGGPADAVVFAASEEDVRTVARLCREHGAPLAVVGRGSNLLVRDGGLRGVVLCLGKDFARIAVRGGEIFAQAGAALGALALAARDAELAGLEFAAGIPGSVGGAAAMNAGAYGGEIAQVLRSARVLQPDGEIVDMENADLAFGYRTSALQAPGRICLGARFVLQEGYFAGRLIEEAGLKGAHVGGAQVSSLHAGFLINTGGATAGDFLALMERVQRAVYEREGVRLEPEVRILGQDGAEEVG